MDIAKAKPFLRFRLGRGLVKLSSVAQLTKALISGVIGGTWVLGREFEAYAHHEKRFSTKVTFLMLESCGRRHLFNVGTLCSPC